MNNDFILDFINEFINSPYSFARFCFNKHIRMTTVRRDYLPYIKKQNPELLNKFEQNGNIL